MTTTLSLTDEAVSRLKGVLEAQHVPEGALRVYVSPGGCSGFSYGMSLEAEPADDDEIVEQAGVKVVVAVVLLKGSPRWANEFIGNKREHRKTAAGQSRDIARTIFLGIISDPSLSLLTKQVKHPSCLRTCFDRGLAACSPRASANSTSLPSAP